MDPELAPEQENVRRRRALSPHLFEGVDGATWMVLDGARVPKLIRKLDTLEVEYDCLLPGQLDPSMARVAPYLARLRPESEFSDWVLERGWGRSWGIFLKSQQNLGELRKHLRRFLDVKDPEGKVVRFRYYDPRVLRLFLPTCQAAELDYLYGTSAVDAYAMESEDGECLHLFQRDGGQATEELIPCS